MQGFRALHSTACLLSVVTTWLLSLKRKVENWKLKLTFHFQFSTPDALGIGAASFASVSGMSFGDGDEVTELVEVPKFCVRDGN